MINFLKENNNYIVKTNDREIGIIYCEIDGFYVFDSINSYGSYDEYFLEIILNKLKDLNKNWKEEIDNYFELQNKCNGKINDNDCERKYNCDNYKEDSKQTFCNWNDDKCFEDFFMEIK